MVRNPNDVFPGRNAGASLKRSAKTGEVISSIVFPGRNAGASLKRELEQNVGVAGEGLPRQKCRGLIEATCWCRTSARAGRSSPAEMPGPH